MNSESLNSVKVLARVDEIFSHNDQSQSFLNVSQFSFYESEVARFLWKKVVVRNLI